MTALFIYGVHGGGDWFEAVMIIVNAIVYGAVILSVLHFVRRRA